MPPKKRKAIEVVIPEKPHAPEAFRKRGQSKVNFHESKDGKIRPNSIKPALRALENPMLTSPEHHHHSEEKEKKHYKKPAAKKHKAAPKKGSKAHYGKKPKYCCMTCSPDKPCAACCGKKKKPVHKKKKAPAGWVPVNEANRGCAGEFMIWEGVEHYRPLKKTIYTVEKKKAAPKKKAAYVSAMMPRKMVKGVDDSTHKGIDHVRALGDRIVELEKQLEAIAVGKVKAKLTPKKKAKKAAPKKAKAKKTAPKKKIMKAKPMKGLKARTRVLARPPLKEKKRPTKRRAPKKSAAPMERQREPENPVRYQKSEGPEAILKAKQVYKKLDTKLEDLFKEKVSQDGLKENDLKKIEEFNADFTKQAKTTEMQAQMQAAAKQHWPGLFEELAKLNAHNVWVSQVLEPLGVLTLWTRYFEEMESTPAAVGDNGFVGIAVPPVPQAQSIQDLMSFGPDTSAIVPIAVPV
jgi:hypothetical protein